MLFQLSNSCIWRFHEFGVTLYVEKNQHDTNTTQTLNLLFSQQFKSSRELNSGIQEPEPKGS